MFDIIKSSIRPVMLFPQKIQFNFGQSRIETDSTSKKNLNLFNFIVFF